MDCRGWQRSEGGMSALRRVWWVIEDNTTPPFRAFVVVAAVLLAILAVSL